MKSETIRWNWRTQWPGRELNWTLIKHQVSIGKNIRLIFLPQCSSAPFTTTLSGDDLSFLRSGYFTFIILLLDYESYVIFTIIRPTDTGQTLMDQAIILALKECKAGGSALTAPLTNIDGEKRSSLSYINPLDAFIWL